MAPRLFEDVMVKQQLAGVMLTNTIVMSCELVIFFGLIVPRVREALADMLRPPPLPVSQDYRATAYLRAVLGTMREQEDQNIKTIDQSNIALAVVIAALPLIIVGFLFGSSAQLRASRKRHILIDVLFVSVSIVSFQAVFYFLGITWKYPTMPEIHRAVAEDYNKSVKNPVVADNGVNTGILFRNSVVLDALQDMETVGRQEMSSAMGPSTQVSEAVEYIRMYDDLQRTRDPEQLLGLFPGATDTYNDIQRVQQDPQQISGLLPGGTGTYNNLSQQNPGLFDTQQQQVRASEEMLRGMVS